MGPGDFLVHYPKIFFLLNDSIKVNVSLIINKLPFILKFSF